MHAYGNGSDGIDPSFCLHFSGLTPREASLHACNMNMMKKAAKVRKERTLIVRAGTTTTDQNFESPR
jgi:hypothetical protein